MYRGGKWFEITLTELRADITGYVKDVDLAVEELTTNPGDERRLTPEAFFRYTEVEAQNA